jgi:phenylalanyl-tRNA synthetase beta chain
LGFGLQDSGAAVRVQPPSWRRDVEGKADLVEEVARIQGYGALPSTPLPPSIRSRAGCSRRCRRAPARPAGSGRRRLSRGGDMVLHARERRGCSAAASESADRRQSDRLGPRLHAPQRPAQPDRGRGPQRRARLPGRRPVRDRPQLRRRHATGQKLTATAILAPPAPPLGRPDGGPAVHAQGRPAGPADRAGRAQASIQTVRAPRRPGGIPGRSAA